MDPAAVWLIDSCQMTLDNVFSNLYFLLYLFDNQQFPSLFYFSFFPPHFFSRYHSRFLKGAAIGKQELINQYIKNSYIGIIFISETGREKCALSFQDGYAIGDIISRKERIFMFKTFISKDLLRKDQKVAKAYDQLQEQNLMNYIMSLENPNEFLLNEYSSYLNSKL